MLEGQSLRTGRYRDPRSRFLEPEEETERCTDISCTFLEGVGLPKYWES
jgi:hypothetical protein